MSQNNSQHSMATPSTSQVTTQSITDSETHTEQAPTVLRLRGSHNTNGRSVQWAEDVIDNEGLGRKSSKVCCIYHRPKAVDESSDESSSDSSSDSSSGEEEGAKPSKRNTSNKAGKPCKHSHNHNHDQKRARKPSGDEKRAPSPNAYEKAPKPKPRPDVEPAKT